MAAASLTVDLRQAAALLRVSEDEVRERVECGHLAGEVVGGEWRVLLGGPIDVGTSAPAAPRPPGSDMAAAMAQLEAIREAWLAPLVTEIGDLREQLGQLREQREAEGRRTAAAIADAERERSARASDQAQADGIVTLLEAQFAEAERAAERLAADRAAVAAENERLRRILSAVQAINGLEARPGGGRRSVVPAAMRLVAAVVAVVLLAAAAIAPTAGRVGPVMIPLTPDRGLHALDVVVLAVTLPLAVALLRYAWRKPR